MQKGFAPILVVIFIVVAGLIVGGAYYIGKINGFVYTMPFRSPTPLISKVPVNSDSLKTEESLDSGIEIDKYTVSFARVGEKVYLRYRDQYYAPPEDGQIGVSQLKEGIYNASSLTWYGLVNPADDMDHEGAFDDVLSFKVLPGNKNFVFTTRWSKFDGDRSISYINVFYYDQGLGKNKVVNLYSVDSSSVSQNKFLIPIADQISSDGNDISFNMHPCWNCDGQPSSKMLINLDTDQTKIINWVLNFKWLDGGKYSYKDYIEKSCDSPQPGPCIEEPNNLPEKTGVF